MSEHIKRSEKGILASYYTGSNQVFIDIAPHVEYRAGDFVTPGLVAEFTPHTAREYRLPVLGLQILNPDHVWSVISLSDFRPEKPVVAASLPEPDPSGLRHYAGQALRGLRSIAGLAGLRPKNTGSISTSREPEVIMTARIPVIQVLQIVERIILEEAAGGEQSRARRMVLEDLRARVELEGDTPVAPIPAPVYNSDPSSGQSRPS